MNAESWPFALAAAGLLAAWLRASAPLILAALGGLVSDLAGVLNVGLEGILLVAAFFGVVGSAYAPLWFPGAGAWLPPLVGAGLGLAAAVLAALLLGLFHLEFGADLVIAGIGLNLLAAGLTVFLLVSLTGDKGSSAGLASSMLPVLHVPGLAAWPVLDRLVNGEHGAGHHVLVYTAFLAAGLVALLLFRTPLGLRLRAVGEHRAAAAAAGIPVKRVQYAALAASGLLAGLGGIYLSMGYLSAFQADMSAGRGFLALAAVFLGARRPLGTLGAALLFGAASVLAAQLGLLDIPTQVAHMAAPLVTIAAMVVLHQRRTAAQRRELRHAALAQQPAAAPPPLANNKETTA
jgi:ABC-type uncharacterized transport system permease subunit